jgi:bacterioferritin
VVNWFRSAANETLTHAVEAGEMVTLIGGYPSLRIGPLLETHRDDLREMLREAMDFEIHGVDLYKQLLTLAVEAGSITLEEYARGKIAEEALHIGDIDKMLRRPGNTTQAVKTEAP